MDKLIYKKEYFECDCHSFEDIFRLEFWESEENENNDIIYLSTFIHQDRNFIIIPFLQIFLNKSLFNISYWKKYFIEDILFFYQNSIWKRLIFSIKHIFDCKINDSIFNSIIIQDIDIDRLDKFLSLPLTQQDIYNQYITEVFDSYELKNNECRFKFSIEKITNNLSCLVISYNFRTKNGFLKRLKESIKYLLKNHYNSMDFEILALDAAFLRLIIRKYKENK